jgi:hypothetical protein
VLGWKSISSPFERRVLQIAAAPHDLAKPGHVIEAKAGQHEQAETAADSITDPGEQAQALTEVTGTLAEAGRHEQAAAMASRAETVARSITSQGEQAQALTEVAKALAARGDTRQAHHAASAACAVGQWPAVLELVLSLEPLALRACLRTYAVAGWAAPGWRARRRVMTMIMAQ